MRMFIAKAQVPKISLYRSSVYLEGIACSFFHLVVVVHCCSGIADEEHICSFGKCGVNYVSRRRYSC